MTRTARRTAGAVALAVALGAGAPAALAAPSDAKPAHADSGHGQGSKAGDRAQRQILRDISKALFRLAGVLRETRTARLSDDAKAALLTNVQADWQALEDLAAAVKAADSTADLSEVRGDLRELNPQNYTQAVNFLRQAARLAAALDAAEAAAAGDAAAPVTDFAAIRATLEGAVAKALLITASSDRSELRAVQADLVAVHEALGPVLDYLDADEGGDDPVVDPTVP